MTVRELARSQGFPDHFVFYAQDNRVLTVSVFIGQFFVDLVGSDRLDAPTNWERSSMASLDSNRTGVSRDTLQGLGEKEPRPGCTCGCGIYGL